MESCKICEQSIEDQKHFWLAHGIKQSDYYHQYEPRIDLFSKELIPFKNLEQYRSQDFINKINLRKWLAEQPLGTQQNYCFSLLEKRISNKKLNYLPCQVELKSLPQFPSIPTYNKLFGNYYDLAQKLNVNARFEKLEIPKIEIGGVILGDTREQKIVNLDIKIQKLDYGDYTLEQTLVNSEKTGNVFVERKEGGDLISTISTGYDRFRREIERAAINNAYIVVMCEEEIGKMTVFNRLPWFSSKIKAKPEFIMNRIRDLIQSYSNIQFLFCDGRKELTRLLPIVLNLGDLCRKIDLQCAYETKQL